MKRNPENTLKLLLILLIMTLCLYNGVLSAQSNQDAMPQVCFIGEHQKRYDNLINTHNELLLNVCQNSMDKAFDEWTSIMHDLELYADRQQFDLKGVKIWVNIFWTPAGKIDHFVFYPKPNSKNIDYDRMKEIVAGFLRTYPASQPASKKPYSHYGTASFPVYARLADVK
ncbi:MAG: hypothetical protein IPN29_18420 [Saprospiraceae bacterium]|nr:hypothetical protein [Saprospiraceae bacterium]